jgi:copper(I)-binding protein
MKALFALIPLALIAACDRTPPAPPTVTIADAWCRAAPAGAPTGGCYVTLTASADDKLVSVETTAADRAEVHSMDMTDGVMRMRKLDGVDLPAGKAVMLSPGAEHLMIIAPKATLAEGGVVPLTFKFGKAPAQSVEAPIRAAAKMDQGMDHGMDHNMAHGQ